MADRLRVTELDFDTIKSNLKTFLNQQTEFTDYDFEGSGLSVLLDILAYNTHYNAYYLNMVANESFLDTAMLRDSVVSHAKTLGYIPYSTTAPTAIINFEVASGTSTPGTLNIPAGFSFLSNQIDNKSYNFVVLEDTTVTKANTTYYFDNLNIYEGQLITYSFGYNSASNPKQIFTLPDDNIDIKTIQVTVTPQSANTASIVYSKITDVLDITSASESYFLQENRNGKYQIYFGNNDIGKSLPDGATVSVRYLITNGTAANKANNFVATATLIDSLSASQTNFTITPVDAAAGGASRESVDSIKFSAASQFSTQNRLVTTKDYETYIKNNYPSIDSISVWGGEDEIPKVFGKVYVALKPKTNYYISETEKARIVSEIINPKSIISVQAEIRNPEYLYLLLENDVQYNPKKTTATETTLKQNIKQAILNYNTTYLNKFGTIYVASDVESDIAQIDLNAIVGIRTTTRVQKRFQSKLNESASYTINFNVPLNRGTITNKLVSTQFTLFDSTGTIRTALFEEIPQSFTGISEIQIANPGSGYLTTPTITINGDGTGATAEAVIVNSKIQSIKITNRGTDYTRATITITGGSGYGAEAVAVVDGRTGTLRTIYYDTLAQRQIINSNVGSIDYNNGIVTINDIRFITVDSDDGLIRLTIEADKGYLQSTRDTIITIDVDDPTAITTILEKLNT
jgi:hypothetical protein